jgi:tRNA (cytidine32/guanosine34-2'-O)-methyltransferase
MLYKTTSTSDTQNDDQVKIVAVDLQSMAPLPGVEQIKGDITKRSTIEEILQCFQTSNSLTMNKADLVICDGAPDVTGLHDIDEFIQGNLVLAALNICLHVLNDNGNFVSKIFRTKNIDLLYQQLKLFFDDVVIAKPRSSRNSSVESFVVCRQFHLPDNFSPNMDEPFVYVYEQALINQQRSSCLIPFIACGSLDGFDSDKTYPLEDTHAYIEPVQPPIHPAYEQACVLKKNKLLPTTSS